MSKKLILAVFLAAVPLAPAWAMDVATFVNKADALEKKGMMALFSSDYKALKSEVQTAAVQLRAERLAAQKANRPTAFCPTQKAVQLDAKELLGHFRAIPPAQRARLQVKDGLRNLFARKYPCR